MLPALAPLLAGGMLLAQVALPPPRVTVAIAPRIERFRFHFENPSNFDTVELVPHFYEQRYEADNTWLVFNADYRFLGGRAQTQVGMTPRVARSGSDIDTFFQPSGDVVTSGTDGRVWLQSFAIEQRVGVTSMGRWALGVAIGYEHARATFFPADLTVTHTQPRSTSATLTTARESTTSRTLQSGVTLEREWHLPRAWQVGVAVDGLPITRARLTTSLPDKYDHDIVSDALAFGATARLTFERRWRRLVPGVAVSGGGAWGYRGRASYQKRLGGVSVFVRYPY